MADMADNSLTIADFEKAMAVLFPATEAKRLQFADSDFDMMSQLLTQVGKPEWSCRPRTYAVLRTIDRIDLFDTFIFEGLKDIAFPYTESRLPNSLTPATKTKILQAQNLVLAKASDLEKSGGRHRHLDEDADAHFHILRVLGRGGFGEVHHVRSKLSLEEYARKRVHRRKAFSKDKEAIKTFENELTNLKRLSHHHLVQLVGSYTDPKYVGILISPVANCDLKVFLERDPFPKDDLHILRGFFGCLCSAVLYLHNSKCRHKDLKPGNILVHMKNVLITDFGTARDWSELSRSTTIGRSGAYTPGYAAPEVVLEEPRGSSADIWSLGCVYLDMMTVLKGETMASKDQFFVSNGTGGANPRSNSKALELWLARLSSKEDKEPIEWIKEMIKKAPNERITAAGLMERIHNYEDGYVYYNSCCNGEVESENGTSYQGSISEEDISAIEDSQNSTKAWIDDGAANTRVPPSSQALGEVPIQPQEIPPRPLNGKNIKEPRTVIHHSDAALELGPVDAQAPQLYSLEQLQIFKDNWNYARFNNFSVPGVENYDQAHQEAVYTIQLSGDFLVTAGRDTTIRIWNIKTGALVRGPLKGHTASVFCLKFDESEKEDVIISAGSDASFITWEFSTGVLRRKVNRAHGSSILHLCFDENYLVTGSKDKLIKVWNRKGQTLGRATNTPNKSGYLPSYSVIMTLVGHTAAVNTIQLDKSEIISGSGDRTIKIWSLETGECLRTIEGHILGIACLQLDSGYIISGSSDSTVRIFDRATGKEEFCLVGHSNLVRSLQVSFADNRIVSGSYDGTIIVWQQNASGNWIVRHRLHEFNSFVTAAIKSAGQRSISPDPLRKDSTINWIFGVQFDSRFLICCGMRRIVGWDFSSGNSTEVEVSNSHSESKDIWQALLE